MEIDQIEMDASKNGVQRFVDMHLYMTSLKEDTDMKGVGLKLALDLMHKRFNKDILTGLQTRAQAGRPNWDAVRSTYTFLLKQNP